MKLNKEKRRTEGAHLPHTLAGGISGLRSGEVSDTIMGMGAYLTKNP